jgi:hypothetical protein
LISRWRLDLVGKPNSELLETFLALRRLQFPPSAVDLTSVWLATGLANPESFEEHDKLHAPEMLECARYPCDLKSEKAVLRRLNTESQGEASQLLGLR